MNGYLTAVLEMIPAPMVETVLREWDGDEEWMPSPEDWNVDR